MLDWLKSAWARWKVQVSVVGGVLVVASAYGTCSYDPQTVSEAEVAPTTETNTTVEVSSTANGDETTGTTTGTDTTTTNTDTTTTETTTETTTTEQLQPLADR